MDWDGNRVRISSGSPSPVAAGVSRRDYVFIPTIGNIVVPTYCEARTPDDRNIITSMFSQGRHWPLGSALSSVLTFGVMIFIALYIRYSESKKINLVEA
jgi:ABC-type spermidine/putrescine transport system permease subunit I